MIPSTTWMIAAAVCASACAVALSLWLAYARHRKAETLRKEAIRELEAAEYEVNEAVCSGDANRVRRARRRLQAALDAKRGNGTR